MSRKKVVHIHSNVYTNGAPQAPASGVLEKGEIAVNYNDTEPALFIENNSGNIVKFNPITYGDLTAITHDVSTLQTNVNDLAAMKLKINGSDVMLSANTGSFYAPTASGATDTILASNGSNSSPKWISQSAITAGSAAQANKTVGTLSVSGNGTSIISFDGSQNVTANITYQTVGAAPETHSHDAGQLPTATSSAYGVTILGTSAGTAAEGNHTHSEYVNPTVVNCAQTLSWGTTATAATIGNTAITITAMAKPSPSDIGAANATHSHDAGQLPTAATDEYGVIKVGDFLSVSNGIVSVATGTTSSTVAKGDHTHSYAGSDSVGGAANSTKGTLTVKDVNNNTVFTFNGSANSSVTLTYQTVGAAPETHSHDAGQLPTATTSAYGITILGTSAGTAAEGNHTHSEYVNPTVVNCAQTLSWGTTTTAATIGNTAITVTTMAKPSPSDIGAANATHSHDAGQLPTAATDEYGVMKVGDFLSVSNGIVSVATGTTSSTVAKGDHTHSYAGSDSVGGAANSTKGTLSIKNNLNNEILSFNGSANSSITLTYQTVGAAPESHTHEISDLPYETTLSSSSTGLPTSNAVKTYVDGLVASPVNYMGARTTGTLPDSAKVGDLYIVQTSAINLSSSQSATGAAQTAETGDYIIARTSGSSATWDVIQKNLTGAVTAAENLDTDYFVAGNGAQTIKKTFYSASSFALASHTHNAVDLPTAETNAYGIVKVGDFINVSNGVISVATGTTSLTVARGDHSHSEYVNPAVVNCAQTLSFGNTTTIGKVGDTAFTVTAMSLPTADTNAYGVVEVGDFINVTNGIISVATGTSSSTIARGDHTHELPTAATNAYGIVKVGDFINVSDGVISVATGTSSSTIARGDHTHSYAGSDTAGGAANSTKGTLTINDYLGSAVTVFNGSESTSLTLTYDLVGAAAYNHAHVASDLPVATSSAYGITILGTQAGTAAEGNHSHGMASTSSYGMMRVGDGLSVTNGIVSVNTGTTSGTIAAGNHTHVASSLPTASTSAYGIVRVGNFINVSNGIISVATGTSSSTIARGDHTHELPTAATNTYGVMKVGDGLSVNNGVVSVNTGTTSGTIAAGNHTHSGGDITSAVANATDADKIDGYHVLVVSSVPGTLANDTIYILQ